MSRGVNKVILIGNLGQDPDIRYMPNGNAVANISMATSESWKDKTTQEDREKTEWHRVVFFSKLAEIVSRYLVSGSQIYIEGKLQTRKWQDKDGNDRYTTEIVANQMQMLDKRGKVVSSDAAVSDEKPKQKSPSQEQQKPSFDDDIPF